MSVEVSRESADVNRESVEEYQLPSYQRHILHTHGLSAEGAKAAVKKMLMLDDPPHIKI